MQSVCWINFDTMQFKVFVSRESLPLGIGGDDFQSDLTGYSLLKLYITGKHYAKLPLSSVSHETEFMCKHEEGLGRLCASVSEYQMMCKV